MKAEELRIGNFIMDSDTDRIGHVVRLSKKKVSVKLEHSTLWQDIDEFEPIPLSEEVLLKCGFEEDETHVSEDHPWAIWVKNDVVISLPYFKFSFESTDVEIKYLHHLQNLIYALTGEELEVSL